MTLVSPVAIVSADCVELSAGVLVRVPGSWSDYQALVERLGDRTLPRIRYRLGEILLMSPLPRHGREANGLADVAKVLLDYFDRDYAAFTPITMTLPEISGLEPDFCFYIDNCAAIAGKDRIEWGVDPAPDLVIEVDVTSYTAIEDYHPYGVPEIWLWKQGLQIYRWQPEEYHLVTESGFFPTVPLGEWVSRYLELARAQHTRAAMRDLRSKLVQLA